MLVHCHQVYLPVCYRLAEYIESEPARKQAEKEAKRAKLEALERKLGIDPSNPSGSFETLAGKKHRLDDTEFLNEHQEIVDNVKSAVTVGTCLVGQDDVSRAYVIRRSLEEEKEGQDLAAFCWRLYCQNSSRGSLLC